MRYDLIVIGAGHNGLVAACYLAKAGLKPLLLERRERAGGAAITEEIHPGFRCSTLAHSAGPLSPQVTADLNLKRHGLEVLKSDVRVLALGANGQSLCLYEDQSRTVAGLEKLSRADAKSYPEFEQSFARIGRVLAPILSMTPPTVDKPAIGEVLGLGRVGLAFRRLGKARRVQIAALGADGSCRSRRRMV